jgi:translation initiation factor IF-2
MDSDLFAGPSGRAHLVGVAPLGGDDCTRFQVPPTLLLQRPEVGVTPAVDSPAAASRRGQQFRATPGWQARHRHDDELAALRAPHATRGGSAPAAPAAPPAARPRRSPLHPLIGWFPAAGPACGLPGRRHRVGVGARGGRRRRRASAAHLLRLHQGPVPPRRPLPLQPRPGPHRGRQLRGARHLFRLPEGRLRPRRALQVQPRPGRGPGGGGGGGGGRAIGGRPRRAHLLRLCQGALRQRRRLPLQPRPGGGAAPAGAGGGGRRVRRLQPRAVRPRRGLPLRTPACWRSRTQPRRRCCCCCGGGGGGRGGGSDAPWMGGLDGRLARAAWD